MLVWCRKLYPVVQDDVSVFVLDPKPPCWVASFLPAVGVNGLHCAVWILPPLVFSSVYFLLARVEVDLFGAVPNANGTYSLMEIAGGGTRSQWLGEIVTNKLNGFSLYLFKGEVYFLVLN